MKLQGKIIALVSMVLVSVLSMYSYFNIKSMKEQVMIHLDNSATILAQSLEQSVITSGAMDNRELLQKLVIDFNRVDGIHEVYVVNRDFKIIAHPEGDHLGQTYDNDDVKTAILYGKKTSEYKQENDLKLYDVVVPVINNGQTLGAIEVELEFSKIQKMIYSASVKAIGSILLTLVILILILIVIFLTVIIKPLNNLVQATSMVAAGSFQPISIPASEDEIGKLIKSFNKMCISLQKLSEKDKSSNPLTGLPGNPIIKQEIDKRLISGQQFSILYADLDHFKDFNDNNGFEFGDMIIKFTAEVLQQALNEAGEPGDFLGHVGGDDFVLVTGLDNGEKVAKQIIELFDERAAVLHEENDTVQLSISVAVVKSDRAQYNDSYTLCEKAAKLKKKAKQIEGSSYLAE